ncbi:MAG: type IA DNA topoisomerase [Lachnospiraceae bacterium]|nr:type IA DNA topoisomerase [Lachnospiraceae bacterium]
MSKALFIAEKPSVAQEFIKALKINGKKADGYTENDEYVVTWCVGHLVTMSYPDVYDEKLKRWSLETLPFLPKEFRYEVIDNVKKQFNIVKGLLNREDVATIYVCTDSGREGEYIYRLVEQMAEVKSKARKRVWIDSQTEEEILRGIREAKDLTEYDNLAASAYLRAKEDYLMGINFSRVLTLKYGRSIQNYLKLDRAVVSVGRVMTCVLGMVVRREREIRSFVKTPFYRVIASLKFNDFPFDAEWRVNEKSKYFETPFLYKENGFNQKEKAEELINTIESRSDKTLVVSNIEKKKETKNPPLLFNLAELQNECSKLFKISPDETLRITQELYEKKLVTYPRTDARVLSTAVSKEIYKNINGLKALDMFKEYCEEISASGSYKNIAKTRYVNDKQITDHYAIIPTGQGFGALNSINPVARKVYQVIARRFLSIFYPPAIYQKVSLVCTANVSEETAENFHASFKVLLEEGYLKIANVKRDNADADNDKKNNTENAEDQNNGEDTKEQGDIEIKPDLEIIEQLKKLKKNDILPLNGLSIKEGETSPPKRYNSGSMILAMENAGQLIEDEELRAQIKGSGIGTSATRAEILKKLVNIKYIRLNNKTQIITPSQMGEMIYDVVDCSIKQLLNPELTASWEKGLTYVSEGSITSKEYMDKLETFVANRVNGVKKLNNQFELNKYFERASEYYR